MSIRDDRLNAGDQAGGCVMMLALMVMACLPIIAALVLWAMVS